MSNDTYTIKQAAQIIKVSEQTIRRRIKDGTLPGEKVKDEYGVDRWLIPTNAIDVSVEIRDVVPLTRQVSLIEMQTAMQNALSAAVQKEVAPLMEQNKLLADALADQDKKINNLLEIQKNGNHQFLKLREELEAHNRRTDERLRGAMAPKSLWQRIIGS